MTSVLDVQSQHTWGPSEASRKCSPQLTLYFSASPTIKHRTLSGIEGAEKQYISDETQEVKIDFHVPERENTGLVDPPRKTLNSKQPSYIIPQQLLSSLTFVRQVSADVPLRVTTPSTLSDPALG